MIELIFHFAATLKVCRVNKLLVQLTHHVS
jgi:hypothetical protein